MAALLAIGAMGILVFLIALVIGGFFLSIGAKWAGIEDVTLGKAMIAVLGGGILAAVLSLIPILGFILGIIGYIWVIKTVFNTDWGKAIVAWILTIVVELIVALILGVLVGVSLFAAL